MASNEQYFAAIVLSIIATSTFIGGVNLAYNGHFPDLSTPAGTIQDQQTIALSSGFSKLSKSGFIGILSGQNYTYPTGYNMNITLIRGGTWGQSALGYGLVSDDFINDPLIALRNVIGTGNIYTVSYAINNIPNAEFYITPRHISSGFSVFGEGKTGSDLRLEFKQDGIYIPSYPPSIFSWSQGSDYFYALPNSQQTLSQGSIITTKLTDVTSGEELSTNSATIPKNSLLSVTKDGITLFSVYVRDYATGYFSESGSEIPRYAGAGSHIPGFTIIEIKTPIQYTSNTGSLAAEVGEQGFWAAVTAAANAFVGLINGVLTFIWMVLDILKFSIASDICPVWVTAIVIIPQLAGLALTAAKLGRGTS